MKTFTFTLNCEIEARDEKQVIRIAQEIAEAVKHGVGHFWKLRYVEADDIEEA